VIFLSDCSSDALSEGCFYLKVGKLITFGIQNNSLVLLFRCFSLILELDCRSTWLWMVLKALIHAYFPAKHSNFEYFLFQNGSQDSQERSLFECPKEPSVLEKSMRLVKLQTQSSICACKSCNAA